MVLFFDDNFRGPRKSDQVMEKSYTNGAIAFVSAATFSYLADKALLRASKPYAKLANHYRFYPWALFTLAVFQYWVEDTEVKAVYFDPNRHADYQRDDEEALKEYANKIGAKLDEDPNVVKTLLPTPAAVLPPEVFAAPSSSSAPNNVVSKATESVVDAMEANKNVV